MNVKEVKYQLGRSDGGNVDIANGAFDGVSVWEHDGTQRVSIMWTTPEHLRTETVLMGDTDDLIRLLNGVIRYLDVGDEGTIR